MDEQAFVLLVARLERIETKVDKLMAFRSYMAGISATFGVIGAYLHSLIKGY